MNNPVKCVSNKTRSTSKPNKQALKIGADGKVEIFGVKNPDIKQVKDGDIITYEVEPNKQKTDWENNFKFFCNKEQTEILVHPTEIIDFISKILQQQKTEIIKEIEGIVGEDEKIEIPETNGEFSLEFGKNRRNELRQEIRERLKQITNLKEK